jgi:hypothetical protein
MNQLSQIAIECVKYFAIAIVEVFGEHYLRAPNAKDTARLLATNEARGFPGMFGSIGCMHCSWKNCPVAWHGQFQGAKKDPPSSLKPWPMKRLGFGIVFFGMPGSCNDINILLRFPLMTRIAKREGPQVQFEANGHTYNYGYYLADVIYQVANICEAG